MFENINVNNFVITNHNNRNLATTRTKNSKTANTFLKNYVENVDVNTFNPNTQSDDSSSSSNTFDGTVTIMSDFDLVCSSNTDDEIQKALYGDLPGVQWCSCDETTMSVMCLTGEENCSTGNYCTNHYDYWFFNSITRSFSFLLWCELCESDDCTLFDGWCLAMLYQFGGEQPNTCQVGFESDNWNPNPSCLAYTGCTVCTAVGTPYYGASSPACGLTQDFTQCYYSPVFTSPFPTLRANAVSASQEKSSSSNVGSIVGSIVGVLAFVLIGGGIYYWLHNRFPDEDENKNNTVAGNNSTTQQSSPTTPSTYQKKELDDTEDSS